MRRPLIALAVLLCLAPPAAAQEENAVVVARHGAVELAAHDDSRSLCMDLRGERGEAGTCGNPLTPYEGGVVVLDDGERRFVGGAVPSRDGTASVEVEYADGDRARASTIAGEAYTGRFRGRVVFFIAETTAARPEPEEEPVLVRRFDAAGKLIGAAPGGHEGGTVAGPRTVYRRAGTAVAATATRSFAPSVLQVDRLERRVCLSIEHRDGSGSGGNCTGTGPAYPGLELHTDRPCGRGAVVHGFAAPDAAVLEVTLGSGRRRRVPTYDLTDLGTAARAVVYVAPLREAVRRARALDEAGAEVGEQAIGAAPAQRCGQHGGSSSSFSVFHRDTTGIETAAPADGQQVALAGAGGSRLLLRDEGEDHLCVGVGELAAGKHDCMVPPPSPFFPAFDVDTGAERTAVGGIAPAGAAIVRIVLAGGRKVDAVLGDGGDYTGRFRGHLRFFLAETPGRRGVMAIETYDALGNLVSALPGPGAETPPPRTFARRGGVRIFGSRYDFRIKLPEERVQRIRGTCIGMAMGSERPSAHACGYVGPYNFSGRVACSPRLGVMMGRLTGAMRGVRVTLADGRTIASQTVRIPRRLGGGRVWVLTIPRAARIVRLRYLGQRPRLGRHGPRPAAAGRYALPSPAAQCGYALPDPTF